MRAFLVVCLGLAGLSAACAGKADQREFTLQGQIISVTPNRDQATVNHEEIKGFMPAMTMPYEVRDAQLLDGLAPGDLINATLIVFSNGAFVQWPGSMRKDGASLGGRVMGVGGVCEGVVCVGVPGCPGRGG